MFSCTWLLQQMDAFASQVSVHCRGHRLAPASYYTSADMYRTVYKTAKTLQKSTAITEVFYCFTDAIGLPGDASNYKDKRSAVATRIQNKCGCRVRQSVRIRSEILAIWAALKQLSEDKNDAMCVVLLRLAKKKKFSMLPSFCQNWHLT